MISKSQNVNDAIKILKDDQPIEPVPNNLLLVKKLQNEKQFHFARLILSRIKLDSIDPIHREFFHNLAICTAQDPYLIIDDKLDVALTILANSENKQDPQALADTKALEIAGYIYFQKWKLTARLEELMQAGKFFLRACNDGSSLTEKTASSAANAALVLDLLVHLENENNLQLFASSQAIKEKEDKVNEIRNNIIGLCKGCNWLIKDYWFCATMAETYLGLNKIIPACGCLEKAITHISTEERWKFETTFNSFAYLKFLKKIPDADWESLLNCFKPKYKNFNMKALKNPIPGKFGLALSGGGFRASLFHIGVLAKLAELGLLRHIEVISCVSGGSIIGAYYYLELRQLLKTKADNTFQITDTDYCKLIDDMAARFLEGIQNNLRIQVGKNSIVEYIKKLGRNFSNGQILAHLFEKELFSKIPTKKDKIPVSFDELAFTPKGEDPKIFIPSFDNWRRFAKVPQLILNATTLNTGHNWQYTLDKMGEPQFGITSKIDVNDQLGWVDFDEAKKNIHFKIGEAVAASACVPGIFAPMALLDLYNENIIVRLVDGGVFDNQGIAGLLAEDCTILLVSDGSGLLENIDDPNPRFLGTLKRTNDILMKRVKEAQYREITGLRRAAIAKDFMYVHLTNDLPIRVVDWNNSTLKFRPAYEVPQRDPSISNTTKYGINQEYQKKIAEIRTDLDSFCDLEAHALMTSGYFQTEHEVQKMTTIKHLINQVTYKWNFLNIIKETKEVMEKKPEENDKIIKVLDVARHRSFKWLRILSLLYPKMKFYSFITGSILLFACCNYFLYNSSICNVTYKRMINNDIKFVLLLISSILSFNIIFILYILIDASIIKYLILSIVQILYFLINIVIKLCLAIAFFFHQLIFDSIYIKNGKNR